MKTEGLASMVKGAGLPYYGVNSAASCYMSNGMMMVGGYNVIPLAYRITWSWLQEHLSMIQMMHWRHLLDGMIQTVRPGPEYTTNCGVTMYPLLMMDLNNSGSGYSVQTGVQAHLFLTFLLILCTPVGDAIAGCGGYEFVLLE